jgi:predicted O-methyltransferase YrrM
MDKLQEIIQACPGFHRSETEIDRPFNLDESLLSREAAAQLASSALTCYGIEPEVLSYIAENVGQASRTLETGAGRSTLVFAIRGAKHIAITPAQSEIELITQYASEQGISMDNVRFVQEPSDRYLPRCEAEQIDLVLLDGKHAFPWPVVDWFFTADRLRQGGVMIIDDVHLRSVAILAEFMKLDPGWQLVRDFSAKTLAFKKLRDFVHDVAWHMQPFTVGQRSENSVRPALFYRIVRRLKHFLAR